MPKQSIQELENEVARLAQANRELRQKASLESRCDRAKLINNIIAALMDAGDDFGAQLVDTNFLKRINGLKG